MTRRKTLAAMALALFATQAAAEEKHVLFATWRGCEEACQGVLDYLNEVDPNIQVTVRDAARDKEQLEGIVPEARASSVDAIISWGTSVTLATAGTLAQRNDAAKNTDIPQVFMIVADPVGSGIVESLEATGRPNLTGTYNRVPETVTVNTLRRIVPDFGTLGLLYNPNETNSVVKRDELAALLPEMGIDFVDIGFELTEAGLPKVEDIGELVRRLKHNGADALYVGSSSFLRSNAAILGSAAKSAELPVISSYEEMVRDGNALISVAARYYDVGQLAGQQVAAILIDGQDPGSLPVAKMEEFALTVNLSFAGEIGVWPPVDLLEFADVVK
ncbi:ABC transporter substrate-binding protein [Celeribacter litoreus]|uniref:ABC transporter substrate-binding protein n=1 Tax=Celeribacter litoreus TaxID=2876714 RepID=UPI001CCE6698|nr:ABC transporter substrate-binding protein [Celeribacter litoreus]MCA0043161.1 ABC transporter substrate-binding protein [Celeribacter litoreus]